MSYDDSNKGAAWPNASDNVKAPQWTGKATVDGKEWRVSVWMRTTKKGPTLSLTFEEPQQRGAGFERTNAGRQDAPPPRNDFDDEIPFDYGR